MSRIIGLAGRSGVGKDTIALEFQRYGFAPLALADDAKMELAIKQNVPIESLYGVRTPEMRDLTIAYAEGERATHGEDYWAKRLLLKISQLRERNIVHDVVIPDVRKQIEIDTLIAAGAVLFKVTAPSRLASNGMTPEQIAAEDYIDELSGFTGEFDNEPDTGTPIQMQVRRLVYRIPDALAANRRSNGSPFVTGA